MNKLVIKIFVICSVLYLSGCTSTDRQPAEHSSCPQDKFNAIAILLNISDGAGHGPDVGSEEWQSAVEFQLGIRGAAATPGRNSMVWCDYIHQQLIDAKNTAGPSFSCDSVRPGSIEQLICLNARLGELDNLLSVVFAQAAQPS